MFYFYTHWKRQKTKGLLTFSRGTGIRQVSKSLDIVSIVHIQHINLVFALYTEAHLGPFETCMMGIFCSNFFRRKVSA